MAFGNLAISTVSSAYGEASQYAVNRLEQYLKEKLFGDKRSLVFVYDGNTTFLQSLVNSTISRVSSQLMQEAKNLIRSKKKTEHTRKFSEEVKNARYYKVQTGKSQLDDNRYGCMSIKDVNGNPHVVKCLDYMGYTCHDGFMAKIPTKDAVNYSKNVNLTTENDTEIISKTYQDENNTFDAKYLVWYDPTALVTINSDKNLVLTKVAGRDYSRKELISNGDISFSVSGHILSGVAEVYPESIVRKFIQTMQYKGVVEINNIILDQFNISKIVIKDFSLAPVEGDKSRQDYSFNAVGIQPAKETTSYEDMLILDKYIKNNKTTTESKWSKFVKGAVNGLGNQLETVFDSIGSEGVGVLQKEIKGNI